MDSGTDNGDYMRKRLSAAAVTSLLLLCACPAQAQYDGFEVPPGLENTPIPRRLPSVLNPYVAPRPVAPPDEGLAYSFKEFKLGMSLDDFNKAGAPAGVDKAAVKLVCSCDAGQKIEILSAEDAAAKVIQCGFWTKAADDTATLPYRMTVAGVECSPDFRFIEDGGIYRLMEVAISFYSSNFKDVEAALTAKYGNPIARRQQKIATESGNIFKSTYLIWDNGVSRIRLSDVDGNNPARAKLRYIQHRLYTAYNSRIDTQHASPIKRASDDL